jgi:tRNA U34 2-thiouridine synthase MnmA/TrmU
MRCVALSSGGLDSMLAIRIMQEMDIEVEALNFKTVFTCCQDRAGQTARDLGVRVTVIGQEDDYLDLIREPQFGYGKGANPCVDCRIYMFDKAKAFMHQVGAQFIVSGEVVGQRPMSQKRRDLDIIAYHSDCEDLLLRPLSARLLRPTLPEREGWVDRERLYGFQGRSRKGLIALAKQLGLKDIPTPSTGCALTEPRFSLKVFDLLHQPREAQRWDFELLKSGRHFRFDAHTKIVVGRDESENEQLAYMHGLPEANSSVALFPENFNGPRALLIGPATEAAMEFAGALLLRYAGYYDPENALVLVEQKNESRLIQVYPRQEALHAKTVATRE